MQSLVAVAAHHKQATSFARMQLALKRFQLCAIKNISPLRLQLKKTHTISLFLRNAMLEK